MVDRRIRKRTFAFRIYLIIQKAWPFFKNFFVEVRVYGLLFDYFFASKKRRVAVPELGRATFKTVILSKKIAKLLAGTEVKADFLTLNYKRN